MEFALFTCSLPLPGPEAESQSNLLSAYRSSFPTYQYKIQFKRAVRGTMMRNLCLCGLQVDEKR